MLLVATNSGTLIIALPNLERALGTSLLTLVWVILAYMISSTVLVLTAGRLSDLFGRPALADSAIGRLFAGLGHTPKVAEEGHATNLTVGMLSVIPMLTLGGLFFLLGSRSLPQDTEAARAESAGAEDDGTILH